MYIVNVNTCQLDFVSIINIFSEIYKTPFRGSISKCYYMLTVDLPLLDRVHHKSDHIKRDHRPQIIQNKVTGHR